MKVVKSLILCAMFIFCLSCNSDIFFDDIPIPPEINYVSPPNNTTEVMLNRTILVSFNTEMDMSSINHNSFFLSNSNGDKITGTIDFYGNQIVLFTPNNEEKASDDKSLYDYNSRYFLTVVDTVKDIKNCSLLEECSISFTTGDIIDNIAPVIVPELSGLKDNNIDVAFSETLNPLTVSSSFDSKKIMIMDKNKVEIEANIKYYPEKNTISFQTNLELSDENIYYVAIDHGSVSDLAGNFIEENYLLVFNNGTVVDQGVKRPKRITVYFDNQVIENNQNLDLGYTSETIAGVTKVFTIKNERDEHIAIHSLELENEDGIFTIDKSNVQDVLASKASVEFKLDFLSNVPGDRFNKVKLLTEDSDIPLYEINLTYHVNESFSDSKTYTNDNVFVAPQEFDIITAKITIIGAGGHGGNGADVGSMNGHRGAGGGGGGAGEVVVLNNYNMTPGGNYDIGVRTVRVVGSGNSVSYISAGESSFAYNGSVLKRARNGSNGKNATNRINKGAGGSGYPKGSSGSDGRWVKFNEGSSNNGSITGASGGSGGNNGNSYGKGGTGGKGGTSRTATASYYNGKRGSAGSSGGVIINWTGHYLRKVD